MRIFLSYAAQQKSVAEPIAFSLRSRGHKVFLDRDDLPVGESYDDQIEAAIGQSDLFIFLISPESITKGRFTQTELAWARAKWPAADRNVLPVMIAPVDLAEVPSYLKAVTILEPMGNIAAEVSAAVEGLARGPAAEVVVPSLGLAGALSGLAAGSLSWVTPSSIGESVLTVTLGPYVIQHTKYAPLYVPIFFTLAVYLALRLWSPVKLRRWFVMLLLVTVGWIIAVNIALSLPNPFGFNLSLQAEQLNVTDENERAKIVEALNNIGERSRTFGTLFNGFVAGAVGAVFCGLGLFASLSGPRRRLSFSQYAGIAVVGGLAGFFVHNDLAMTKVFDNTWLVLFVVWQGCVAAALAYALASSRSG
jgi:hypothetical protein